MISSLASSPVHVGAPPRAPPLERWGPVVAGLLLCLPVLLSTYPPSSDLPYHEAEVAILRRFSDRAMFPVELYSTNFGHPNQLFHLLSLGLSYALPIRAACRLVLAVGVVGVPLGAARLADHVAASRWSAVLVAPIAIGWLLFMGLVANLLGLGLLLALLPTLDRFVVTPTAQGAAKTSGACVLLYLAHEAMLFIFVAALAIFVASYVKRFARALALRAVPGVFAGGLIVWQLRYQEHLFTAARDTRTVFTPLVPKLLGLPGCLFSAFDPCGARLVFALSMGAIGVFLAGRIRTGLRSPSALPHTAGQLAHHFRFELLALLCAGGYFFAPEILNGATFVYHRFLPPGFALLAVLAARRGRPRSTPLSTPRTALLLAGATPLAALLVLWPAFAEASRSVQELETLLPRIEMGSAIAVVAIGRDYTGYARGPEGGLALAERGGRLLFSFSESPIAPVMLRRDKEWTESLVRVTRDELRFCPAWDFRRYRYLLLDSVNPHLQLLVSLAVRPSARLVASQGEWALYEATSPTIPIDSPDEDSPALCATDTLASRVNAISDQTARELRERPPPPGTPIPPVIHLYPTPRQ